MKVINYFFKLWMMIFLLTSCGNEITIGLKQKTYSFDTDGQQNLFPMLRWLTALDGYFYVPELNDCKIFRINTEFETVNYIDLREQFGPFELGQIGILDSQVIVWNRWSNSFYIFTPDLEYIGQHILTHLVEIDNTRIAFSDKSLVGSTGKTVSKFLLQNNSIEFDETILHTDIYKPCHYIENNGYLFLVSESLPTIEVYRGSELVNSFDYGLEFPEVFITIDNFKKKHEALGNRAMFYTLVADAVADNDLLFLLLTSKNEPDGVFSNIVISFLIKDGNIKTEKIYRLKEAKVIRSIAVTNGLLLAVGVERPTNSILLYKLY